eukprot:jgi/Tetstr1/460602/TSEL_000527.t1
MRHCTKLHISHRNLLMPKSNAELAQLMRRTFDVMPAEQRYSEYTRLDTYEIVLRHLEAVDIEHNGGNKRGPHSIMKCPVTSPADKEAWRQKVAASKAAKAATAGIDKLSLERK